MDLIFEVENGYHFSLEVDLFDTVQEIKEKIEKYRGIPACDQTLMFDGEILQDEYAINNYNIVVGSHVKLVAELTPKRISLLVRSPRARAGCLFEVSVDDRVEHLKKLVATAESVHPNQLALLPSGSNVELQDHCSIRECGLELQPQIDVLIRPMPRATKQPPPLPPPSLTLGSSDNITVRVLPWEWKQKVVLGVDRSANVRSLRDELEKMQPSLGYGLPPEGYFFIHNQSCMEENQTFMWHGVEHGDTIEVFRGRIVEDSTPPVSKTTPRYRSY
ncbi:hypothetical protein MLD38_012112 [Melastoma candidum]|uniref:Uncharacterized protein n=1 Tax=Melastoma candidum TaxID=119954 RepID=A0ACB9R5E0_9MYRT|nr:hypothetical protein MLD38_012112 [Melastoma candidum]